MAEVASATTEMSESTAVVRFTAKHREHSITVHAPERCESDHSIHTGGAVIYGSVRVNLESKHPQFEVWKNGHLILSETVNGLQAWEIRNAI